METEGPLFPGLPAVVLHCPRIPQNVGAVARVCAVGGASLHIVRPVPFELSDRTLKRSGMDYLDLLRLRDHLGWPECRAALGPRRFWLLSSSGDQSLFDTRFLPDDALLFGNESSGVPDEVRDEFAGRILRIPMPEPKARCLNLATATAISLFEVLRQTGRLVL